MARGSTWVTVRNSPRGCPEFAQGVSGIRPCYRSSVSGILPGVQVCLLFSGHALVYQDRQHAALPIATRPRFGDVTTATAPSAFKATPGEVVWGRFAHA
jgi:hypothetical protein